MQSVEKIIVVYWLPAVCLFVRQYLSRLLAVHILSHLLTRRFSQKSCEVVLLSDIIIINSVMIPISIVGKFI